MLDDTTIQSTPQSDGTTSVTPDTAGSMTSFSGRDRFTDPHSLGISQSKPTSDPSLATIQAITTRRIDRLQAAFDLLWDEQGLEICAKYAQQVSKLWNVYCTGVKIFLLSRKPVHESCNELIRTAGLLRPQTVDLDQEDLSRLFCRVLFSKFSSICIQELHVADWSSVDILRVITYRLEKEKKPMSLELEISGLYNLGCGSFTSIARDVGWRRVVKAKSSREIWIEYC